MQGCIASLKSLISYFLHSSTYKSEHNIIPLWTMRKETGIKIKGYKFSASGDGKSVCDGFSAIMKRVANSYIADGNSARTALELAAAFVK